MTGILLLFTENTTAGDRDSEKFVNPDIKSVQINIKFKNRSGLSEAGAKLRARTKGL